MRRSEDKNKTVQEATLRCWKAVVLGCWQATANAEHCKILGLQAHSEIATVETQFVPPSELTGLMKEYGLIRCLRNKVKPRSVVFLYPTLPRYLVTWNVLDIRGTRISSVIGWLIIVAVITVSRRAGRCSLI